MERLPINGTPENVEKFPAPEIRHLPGVDLILNHSALREDSISQIAGAVAGQRYLRNSPALDKSFAERFFVKTRKNASPKLVQYMKDIPADQWEKRMTYDRPTTYAFNSLMNEMKVWDSPE